MSWDKEVWDIVSAILVSLGGGAAIIFGFSSWLGKLWADRIMRKDKAKYDKELEEIKDKLQTEREKQKLIFSLYFEGQFKIYNELWVALIELEDGVSQLWESTWLMFVNQIVCERNFKEINYALIATPHLHH